MYIVSQVLGKVRATWYPEDEPPRKRQKLFHRRDTCVVGSVDEVEHEDPSAAPASPLRPLKPEPGSSNCQERERRPYASLLKRPNTSTNSVLPPKQADSTFEEQVHPPPSSKNASSTDASAPEAQTRFRAAPATLHKTTSNTSEARQARPTPPPPSPSLYCDKCARKLAVHETLRQHNWTHITTFVKERTLYDLLDVLPDTKEDDLRKAYKRQALRYHPDKNKEKSAQAKFVAVKEAFDILSDTTKAKLYQAYGLDYARLCKFPDTQQGGGSGTPNASGTAGYGGFPSGGHGFQHFYPGSGWHVPPYPGFAGPYGYGTWPDPGSYPGLFNGPGWAGQQYGDAGYSGFYASQTGAGHTYANTTSNDFDSNAAHGSYTSYSGQKSSSNHDTKSKGASSGKKSSSTRNNVSTSVPNQSPSMIACWGCGYKFNRLQQMFTHLETGQCNRLDQLTFQIAINNVDATWRNLSPSRPLKCGNCKFPFTTMSGLIQHSTTKKYCRPVVWDKGNPSGVYGLLRNLRACLGLPQQSVFGVDI